MGTLEAVANGLSRGPGDRGTVRFGTLVVDMAFARPAYRRALDTHFRAVVGPPGGSADLTLAIVDLDDRAPPLSGDDALAVTRSGATTTWSTAVGWARLDRRLGEAVVALRPAGQREELVLHALAVLVQKVLQGLGLIRLHAGGAAVGDRVVVFTGDKGAGKSTLALAFGQLGAAVLGDDQLALQWSDGGVVVAGSDARIRLTAETEAHFAAEPLPVTPVTLAGVAKKEVALAELVAAQPFTAFVPTELWFPRVGGALASSPLPRREALRRLLADTVPHHRFADPEDRQEFVALLTALVEATETRAIELPPVLADLDRLADELGP